MSDAHDEARRNSAQLLADSIAGVQAQMRGRAMKNAAGRAETLVAAFNDRETAEIVAEWRRVTEQLVNRLESRRTAVLSEAGIAVGPSPDDAPAG